MKRILSGIATIGLCTLILGQGLAPTATAQDGLQAPEPTATALPQDIGGSSQLTPSIFLPLVVGEQGNGELEQGLQEVEVRIDDMLGEVPSTQPAAKSPNAQDDLSLGLLAPEPGLEPAFSESSKGNDSAVMEEGIVSPSAVDGWTTIMSEGFEGAFPNSIWRVGDANGSSYGDYYWDDTSYMAYSGYWSAWAARGGANGLNPYFYNYPNNMRSWMTYGPFDLRNTTDAKLTFNFWNRSEANYDYFQWLVSVDGTNFYGYQVSGDSAGWRTVIFDLKAVPGLGNLTGRSSVWISFRFISDSSVTLKGPFVDNVVLQKNVNSATCPGQYRAEYFNNRTLSGSPIVTRCENWPIKYDWGNSNPVSGIGSDNFSVRWTGTTYLSAGNYTFLAAGDDGVRVWLDNSIIIDGWRDQRPTAYRANRYVSAGNHSIKIEYYEAGGGALVEFSWSPAVANGVPGISYSTRNDFHVFKIDLWSANLSYETVMGLDAVSGNTTKVEFVREMVGRWPYLNRNPVLAFNADYFGVNHHGAEGLTVKNGTRLPNAGTANGDEWRRSSLSISSLKYARLGPETDCIGPPNNACTTWIPNRDSYYNTIGGGPLFVEGGVRVGGASSTQPCIKENLPIRYCTESFKWTAAGVSEKGRYLIVVVSNSYKTMDQAASVLIAENAYRAIKLDGGTSTQLWYKPQGSIVPGGQRITNALLVFSSQ